MDESISCFSDAVKLSKVFTRTRGRVRLLTTGLSCSEGGLVGSPPLLAHLQMMFADWFRSGKMVDLCKIQGVNIYDDAVDLV